MNNNRVIESIICLIVFLFCYFANLILGKKLGLIIDSINIEVMSILVGVIIGCISILMGFVGNFYNSIITLSSLEGINYKVVVDVIDCIEKPLKEIKEGTLFLILFLAISIIIKILKNISIPHISWITDIYFFSKIILLNTLNLSVFLLSFLIIKEIINAIFSFKEIHKELLLQYLKETMPESKI